MTTEQRQQPAEQSNKPDWKTGAHGREPLPLGGYAALIGIFGATVAGMVTWAAEEDKLLDEISVADLAIMGIGSQRLARMITKDRVSTVLRRPFTVYEGTENARPGETTESARREGGALHQAIGELLVCPFCMSTWSATALVGTYLANPKLGRTIGTLLSVVGLAEMMQSVYTKVVH